MFKLDNDFLISLGLGGLPVDEKNKLLQVIYERLEMNVGMRLAEKMTDQQLDEFEGFIDRSDEAGALRWLETNFPNYKDVVAEELEKLKKEVGASAPQIIAASQGAANAPTAMPGPAPAQPQQPYQQPQFGQQAPGQFAQPQPYQPASQPVMQPYQQPSMAPAQPAWQQSQPQATPNPPAPAQNPVPFQPMPPVQPQAPSPQQPAPYIPPMPDSQPPAGPQQ